MPVHVVGIPPGILQALPEKPRLANPPNFVTPRDDPFLAVLPDQFAQGIDQFRLRIVKALVVRPQVDRRIGSASILLASFGFITGRKPCRPAAAVLPSAGAIAPGTPVQDSAVS